MALWQIRGRGGDATRMSWMTLATFHSRSVAGPDNRRVLFPGRPTELAASLSPSNRARNYGHLLASASLVTLALALGAPERALAECVPPPPGDVSGVATCTGTFITRTSSDNDSNPLTLTGVTVTSPGGIAVGVASNVADIAIDADGVTINNTANINSNFGNIGLGLQLATATPPLRQRTPQLT